MRFLLHPIRRVAARGISAKKDAIPPTVTPTTSHLPSSTLSAAADGCEGSSHDDGQQTSTITKQWGQQCGPCACVIRFETHLDSNNEIRSATYVAKEVVTTRVAGRLEPVYTTRTHKPMLRECQCQSLHALAKQVTSYLPHKRMDRIRSMNVFQFTRSSSAFRHAVLAEHNLPRTDTQCFDVLEEAFTAMIEGFMPSRRRINADYKAQLRAEFLQRPLVVAMSPPSSTSPTPTSSASLFPQYQRGKIIRGTGRFGSDRNQMSMTTPRTVSTLKMFDLNAEYWEEEEYANEQARMKNGIGSERLDWLSFVDEQYENGGERSA